MRMAKATETEIRNAVQLARLLESVCHPRNFTMPRFPDTEEEEGQVFDEELPKHLKRFFEEVNRLSDGLTRIVWGYETLLSNVCDPESDVLAFNSRLTALLEKEGGE